MVVAWWCHSGGMVGAWLALEDIHPDAGPFAYYPGSHKLPYVLNDRIDNMGTRWKIGQNGGQPYMAEIQEVIASEGLTEVVHLPNKGDLLLWHANLLHGGIKKVDLARTRRSMAWHFIAKDVICFHEKSQRPAFKPYL